MHELGIAQNILEIALKAVPEIKAPDVRKIRIRVGRFAGVIPDSLEFCFTVVAGESTMPQAALSIEEVPTVARCKTCERQFQPDDFIFICPECQSTDLEILSGRELEIVEIEVADMGDEAL
jgi:hydrogenase nickel incorporation protein HypA/HybF